jgi:hypothetical protein
VSGVNPFVLFNGEIDNGHCNTAANWRKTGKRYL